jgi:hypothetical protein
MNQIQCSNQSAFSSWNGLAMKSSPQSAQVTNTQTTLATKSQNLLLSISTKDGDTVNISLAADSQAAYLDSLKSEPGKAAVSTTLNTASQQNFTLSVQGDLSTQEVSDIGQVLTTLDKMLGSFVNGNLVPMAAQAQKLTQLDTIDGFSLQMNYSQTVLIAQQTQVQAGSDPLGATYDRQGNLVGAAPSTAPAEPTAAQLRSQAAAAADDLTTTMARQMARVREFTDHPFGAVKQIFDKYRRQMQQANPDDSFGPALLDHMHKKLLSKMRHGQTDSTSAAAAGHARTHAA